MPHRLEIRLKDGLFDAEGSSIRKKSKEYFGLEVEQIRIIKVLTIDKEFDQSQLIKIQQLFQNPVTEDSSFSPIAREFDWIIWVGFRPGVKDAAGETAVEAIEDLLSIRFQKGEAVYTSKLYEIKGNLKRDEVEKIAKELLANELIQQWQIFSKEEWDLKKGIGFIIPKVILRHIPEVKRFHIETDDDLKRISFENQCFITHEGKLAKSSK